MRWAFRGAYQQNLPKQCFEPPEPEPEPPEPEPEPEPPEPEPEPEPPEPEPEPEPPEPEPEPEPPEPPDDPEPDPEEAATAQLDVFVEVVTDEPQAISWHKREFI